VCNSRMIYSIEDIIFYKGIVKSACKYASNPVNTWIRTGIVEDIVMDVDVLSFLFRIGLPITLRARFQAHKCHR
jgi:hypothetical protein